MDTNSILSDGGAGYPDYRRDTSGKTGPRIEATARSLDTGRPSGNKAYRELEYAATLRKNTLRTGKCCPIHPDKILIFEESCKYDGRSENELIS